MVLVAAALWSAGAAVVAGGALLAAVAFWSVVLGVCAGGFTGALALSGAVPPGVVVVAAGALALVVSVVEAGAAALDAAVSAAEAPAAAPALAAWLLVQESEIMLTELTCNDPSLARVPWI